MAPALTALAHWAGGEELQTTTAAPGPTLASNLRLRRPGAAPQCLSLAPQDNLTLMLALALSRPYQMPSLPSEISFYLRNVARFSGRCCFQHLWHTSLSCQTGSLLMSQPSTHGRSSSSPLCATAKPEARTTLFCLLLPKCPIGQFQVLVPWTASNWFPPHDRHSPDPGGASGCLTGLLDAGLSLPVPQPGGFRSPPLILSLPLQQPLMAPYGCGMQSPVSKRLSLPSCPIFHHS